MKARPYIIAFASCLLALSSCKEIEVEPYSISDAAIMFKSSQLQYSLRSYDVDDPVIEIGVNLVGPVADYDRVIHCEVIESDANTAVKDVDFSIDSAVVRAGEMSGTIYMKVAPLSGSDRLTTTIRLLCDDNFKWSFKTNSEAQIVWTSGYTCPTSYVFRSWFLLFSHYYSTDFHKIVCEVLGDEVDTYSHYSSAKNYGFTMKPVTWWYSANALLRSYVESYDKAHPDAPLMHSADVVMFSSQFDEPGDGVAPATIPTILETITSI